MKLSAELVEDLTARDFEPACSRLESGDCEGDGLAVWVVRLRHGCVTLYCDGCWMRLVGWVLLWAPDLRWDCVQCGSRARFRTLADLVESATPYEAQR